MIKPDGVQRGLVHKVIERFEQDFYLKAMKMQMVTKEHAEKHYADLSSKPFFAGLVRTCALARSFAWSGKARMLLRLVEKSSVRLIRWPRSRDL